MPVQANQSQTIYINWTGTHNLATALTDLEKAPGEESYRKEESAILMQINTVIKEFNLKSSQKAELFFTGHSLGGALAQLNFHSLQRAIVTNLYVDSLESTNTSVCEEWIAAEKKIVSE